MKFERTSSNSLSPLGAQNKDIGFSLTLLTEFKLCLAHAIRWCDSGVSCVSTLARVHLQGLEGGTMAFV